MIQDSPAPTRLRILHLEDSELDHDLVRRSLARSGEAFELQRVESLAGFREAVQAVQYEVILADYRLPGFTALDAWQVLQEQVRQPPFLLLSGAIGESAAVAAIKLGISDYLAKEDVSKLAPAIRRALAVHEVQRSKQVADEALAVSQRRLADFSEHLQTTIEQERASIAREIHDDIGGALTAVRFDLAWVERHTADAAAQSHLQSARAMLGQALEASQRIMKNLRPAILDQGLAAAVEWLATSFTQRTGVRVLLRNTSTGREIPKAIELVAYRSAQEALTNITKHSQCDLVEIELCDARDVLTLEVRDNGAGISPDALDKPKAFGLRGLQERAKTVAGWLDISSYDKRGTSIILSVPLPPGP
ncbi:MAG: response regulator [Rhodoferax sp.]|nr:response regulator [Rhodoferax sp.]